MVGGAAFGAKALHDAGHRLAYRVVAGVVVARPVFFAVVGGQLHQYGFGVGLGQRLQVHAQPLALGVALVDHNEIGFLNQCLQDFFSLRGVGIEDHTLFPRARFRTPNRQGQRHVRGVGLLHPVDRGAEFAQHAGGIGAGNDVAQVQHGVAVQGRLRKSLDGKI